MGRPAPIDATTQSQLRRGVEREGARLRLTTSREQIEACASLLAESDRLRFLIPTVHQEMLAELRWPGRDELEDGMDVRTLEMDPASLGALELLPRPDVMAHLADWRGGQALGLRTQAMVSSSSASRPHHGAQGRPRLVRARGCRDRALLVERGARGSRGPAGLAALPLRDGPKWIS